MKRPLWCLGCVFSATLLLLSCFAFEAAVYLGILCCFLAVPIALLSALRRNVVVWAVLLAVTAACICSAFHYMRTVKPLSFPTEKTLTLTVQAEEIVQEGTHRIGYFTVLDGELPKGTKLVCSLSNDTAFSCSAWQTVSGTFIVVSTDAAYDFGRNLWLRATPVTVTVSDAAARPWYAIFHDARAYASRLLQQYLNEDLAALTQAICFGQRDLLPAEIGDAFSATGISHLLVTSGMHVAILSQIILLLFKKAGLSRRKAAALATLPVLLIMGLCGFGYSVLRAGIMQLILLTAHFTRREPDGLNSLGGAMLLILFWQPYAVNDIGLWLSFGTTAGILFFHPRIMAAVCRVRSSLLRSLLSTLSVTVCATVPVLPILAIYFREISLISPLTNLMIGFVASPMLFCTYLAVGVSLIPGFEFLVEGLLFLVGLLARYLSDITQLLAEIPYACVPVSHPIIVVLLIGALLSLWVFAFFEKKRSLFWGFGCSLVLFVGSFTICAVAAQPITITALNVGDATALLLQKADHAALVLSTDSSEAAENTAVWLRQHNIERLDALILTTSHNALIEASLTEAVPAVRHIRADADALVDESLWDGLAIREAADGWLRLEGDVSLLLVPSDVTADAQSLPPAWRENDLIVFDRNVPWHLEVLTAQQGILCCEDTQITSWSPAFREVPYQVDDNVKDTVVTVLNNRIIP